MTSSLFEAMVWGALFNKGNVFSRNQWTGDVKTKVCICNNFKGRFWSVSQTKNEEMIISVYSNY